MPNRIIKETKTIIQYKFLDYFFDPIWEDIDCRTEEGQSRYREIFGHSPVKHDTNKYDVKKGDKVLLKSLNIFSSEHSTQRAVLTLTDSNPHSTLYSSFKR